MKLPLFGRLALVGTALSLFFSFTASATLVVVGSNIISASQTSYTFRVQNLVDQSGLSKNYTPSVDDFYDYTNSTTASYYPGPAETIGGSITDYINTATFFEFDLGGVYDLGAVAVWGQDCCESTLLSYDLYGDSVFLGNFSAGLSPNAFVHSFDPVQARFVLMVVTENMRGGGGTNFNEIAFGVNIVPIPATAWLFGSALAGLLVAKRKCT